MFSIVSDLHADEVLALEKRIKELEQQVQLLRKQLLAKDGEELVSRLRGYLA